MWKFIWRTLLLIIVIVIALLAWITMSDGGTRWALQLADKQVAELSIEGIEGRLYDGVQIDKLLYQTPDTTVDATDLNTQWQPSCLIAKKLCLQNISLEQLTLQLPPTSEAPAETTPETEFSIPALPVEIDLENASIGQLTWTQNDVTQSLSDIALSLQADSSSIRISKAALTWEENHASLTGNVELSEQYPIDASLTFDMPTLLGPKSTRLTLNANGLIDGQLTLQAALKGHQNATLDGTVHALETPIRLNGELLGERLQSLEASNQAVVLQQLKLVFNGDLDKLGLETSARISGAEIPPNELSISGQMLDIASLEDLKLRAKALGGEANINGAVHWQPALSWRVDGDFKNIDIEKYRADVKGKLSGSINSSGEQRDGEFLSPSTVVKLRGDLQGYPLTADLQVSLAEKGQLNLKQLELHSGKNHITAKGKIEQTIAIDATIDALDLATLWPGLGGKLQGKISATGERLKPTVKADLNGTAIAFNEFSTANLSLLADIQQGGEKTSKLTLLTDGGSGPGVVNGSVDLQLLGTLGKHSLALLAKTTEQSAELKLQGALQGANWKGSLDSSTLAYQKIELQLQSPTAIAWQSDTAQASVAAHCWLRDNATLCLKNDTTLSAQKGDATIVLNNLDLSDFNPLLPENAKLFGQLNADIDGQWAAGTSPLASVKTDVKNLKLQGIDPQGEQVDVNFSTARLTALLDENQGNFDLELSSPEQGNTRIKTSFDPKIKTLSGDLNLEGFLLKPLLPMLPMLDTLDGEISAKGDFSGTIDDPQFTGRIQLMDPALAGAEIPLTIDGGELKIDINGRKATVNSNFEVTPTGNIQVSGDISFTDKLVATLAINGDKLAVVLPPTVEATVNHKLTVAYSPELLKLRGKIHIPDAVIVLEGMTGSGPSVSSDLVLIDEEDQPIESTEQASALSIDMDIQVQVDDDVRLSGYGFETQLEGDIKVRQRVGQPPQLAGGLDLVNGKYQAYGQDLEVRRGELLFVGPIRATRIDVSAVRVVDQVEAGLMLEGSILEPVTTLFSEPAMPEADVLSYILLGGPPGQGGGDEGAMLARAALGLGLKNGNKIAGQFASAAGIKDFNIGADGKGDDTAVVLSGRISPKLLLSYRVGVFDAVNTLTARYDLNQKLYLELMRGVEQAIDIFYSVDY